MDPRVYIEYEVIDPVSNKRFFTESREEARAHFERECLVYEQHITSCRYSLYEEVKLVLKTNWNNNPRFTGE
jgi:hypothetical protein